MSICESLGQLSTSYCVFVVIVCVRLHVVNVRLASAINFYYFRVNCSVGVVKKLKENKIDYEG